MEPALLAIEARRAPALAALRARAGTIPIVTPCAAPFASTTSSGTRARGLAYERKVGKKLAAHCSKTGEKLWDHQWFKYEKSGITRHFQPDFVIERPAGQSVLIEVKLTLVDTSLQTQKYIDYLRLFGLDCFSVTIVRNLVPNAPKVITSFEELSPNAVMHLWI